MKVFIADDSQEVRQRIVAMLSDLERIDVVGQAENVQNAINSIRELKPDVVILDMRMPGGSGIDVLEKIEKRNGMPVVIMLTNYAHSQYRKRCLAAGADFFFDKSGEFEKVIDVVNGMGSMKHGLQN